MTAKYGPEVVEIILSEYGRGRTTGQIRKKLSQEGIDMPYSSIRNYNPDRPKANESSPEERGKRWNEARLKSPRYVITDYGRDILDLGGSSEGCYGEYTITHVLRHLDERPLNEYELTDSLRSDGRFGASGNREAQVVRLKMTLKRLKRKGFIMGQKTVVAP